MMADKGVLFVGCVAGVASIVVVTVGNYAVRRAGNAAHGVSLTYAAVSGTSAYIDGVQYYMGGTIRTCRRTCLSAQGPAD